MWGRWVSTNISRNKCCGLWFFSLELLEIAGLMTNLRRACWLSINLSPTEHQREIPAGIPAVVHRGFIFHLWMLPALQTYTVSPWWLWTVTHIWKEHEAKYPLWFFVGREKELSKLSRSPCLSPNFHTRAAVSGIDMMSFVFSFHFLMDVN